MKTPSRILITRTDRIGDLVLSTPVFSELRKRFPHAYLACLTFLENHEIVEGNPNLNEVLLYDKKGSEKGIFGQLRFAREVARKKFNVVIHLHATNRMHLLGWLARIPMRIGWARKQAWTLTHSLPDLKREGHKHEAAYNFDLLRFLNVECPPTLQPYFALPARAEKSLDVLLKNLNLDDERPWVILSPGASCPSKRWPAERFGYLADRIQEKYGARVIAISSAHDETLVSRIRENSALGVDDLSGRLSLSMLGHLLKRAALLISNDSGPVHVASAVGTPVISIFGRKQAGLSPRRWAPLDQQSKILWKDVHCDPCLAHACQIKFLCLDAISVEDVLEQVENFSDRFHSKGFSFK